MCPSHPVMNSHSQRNNLGVSLDTIFIITNLVVRMRIFLELEYLERRFYNRRYRSNTFTCIHNWVSQNLSAIIVCCVSVPKSCCTYLSVYFYFLQGIKSKVRTSSGMFLTSEEQNLPIIQVGSLFYINYTF